MASASLIAALVFFRFSNSDNPQSPLSSETDQSQNIRQVAKKLYELCRTQAGSFCYENEINKKLLSNYSPAQIQIAIYDYDTDFSCHAFSHFLGRALYKKTESVADSYSQIDFTCHGGAYHGVIEAYLNKNGVEVADITAGEINRVCRDSKLNSNLNPDQIYSVCLHGFGHAFMFTTEQDLPLSLNYCDKLNSIDRQECYGGAFMENSTSSTSSDHETKWLKKDDKFFPCNALKKNYQSVCYYYQANYLIKITNHDFESVFKDCNQLSSNFKKDCIQGLGASLASFSNEKGVEAAASICALAKAIDANTCIEGAISSLFTRYGGETTKILEFCNFQDDSLKEPCFVELGKVTATWHSQEKIAIICDKAENYQDACLSQSGTNSEF